MDRQYLNEPLADQLLGNACAISPFNAAVLREHKRLVQEGDGFAAVSVYHPDERYELRAHSQHRYQWIISEAVQHLRLPVWHLKHQRIWFNFYGELVRRFGAGTQAYTTETELPHVGMSEIGIREPEVLQMILLHEAQHATDYAFYDGFAMSVSERELRARLTVCQAIKSAKGAGHALYQAAAFDAAQWFALFCLSPQSTDELRDYYYADLDPTIQRLLRRGVRFTPISLIILQPELERERLQLLPDLSYRVTCEAGKLRVRGDHIVLPPAEEELALEPAEIQAELPAAAPPAGPEADELPPEEAPTADSIPDAPAEEEPARPQVILPPVDPVELQPEQHTINSIDDWYNFPIIYQQLTERALVVTDAWARYEIDPTLSLPTLPTAAAPIFKTHQELLRYKTKTGSLAPLRKQSS